MINKIKSKIYFSRGHQRVSELMEAIGFVEGKLPAKYLGIPLSVNYLKARNYSSNIDKCREKIEGWMATTLSFTGRNELIKTVILGSCSIRYNLYISSVLKVLEAMFAKFLWRGKIHAWAWDKICKPKSECGLAVRRIQEINNAAGVKLVCRCCNNPDCEKIG